MLSQAPNLLLNKITNELFIGYSVSDKIKIDKCSIISMIKDWGKIVDLLNPNCRLKQSAFEDKKELKSMVERLKKYI